MKFNEDLIMIMDFYELTMANGFMQNNRANEIAVFDLYFRSVPDNGGFAIAAGLEQVIDYLTNLKFTKKHIDYLKSKNMFSSKFLKYLENFKFECDVYAVPEGTPVFPNEPILTVVGPIIQAQLIETMLLLTINHQTLIATKTSRIVRAANGKDVLEFGSRRAHGYSAAMYGARAAYIGGCSATSNTFADIAFNMPVSGTMAHSWVQSFDNEYEAFKSYAEVYPDKCVLLVDTFNSLKSGVPNAIKVFDEVIVPSGNRPVGIRIDSGDISYISKMAREMLDQAGYEDVKIVASNSLNEYIIRDLEFQKAKVDIFGVGENLITSKSHPVFGGVYKLVAMKKNDEFVPRMKYSDTAEKITTPGFKSVYRLFDNDTGMAQADLLTLREEIIDTTDGIVIFDPIDTWKRKTLVNVSAKMILEPIFIKGELVYETPSLEEIKLYAKEQIDTLWEEIKRFEFPHKYYVDMSENLWNIRYKTLEQKLGKHQE